MVVSLRKDSHHHPNQKSDLFPVFVFTWSSWTASAKTWTQICSSDLSGTKAAGNPALPEQQESRRGELRTMFWSTSVPSPCGKSQRLWLVRIDQGYRILICMTWKTSKDSCNRNGFIRLSSFRLDTFHIFNLYTFVFSLFGALLETKNVIKTIRAKKRVHFILTTNLVSLLG